MLLRCTLSPEQEKMEQVAVRSTLSVVQDRAEQNKSNQKKGKEEGMGVGTKALEENQTLTSVKTQNSMHAGPITKQGHNF